MKGPLIVILILSAGIIAFFGGIKLSILIKRSLVTRDQLVSFINIILLITGTLVFLITLRYDVNYFCFEPPVDYENWQTISIRDFRGLRKPFHTLDGEYKFATVYTRIRVRKTSNENIEIKSLFYPSRSYVYNKNIYSEMLLNHEMYHFHVTEYNARLMRREVDSIIKNKGPVNIRKLTDKYFNRENNMQQLYDEETYHGYVYSIQIEWQKRLDSMLVKINNYSGSQISLEK